MYLLFPSWFISRPGKLESAVPVPALRGDDLHTMSVLPYLIAYHYGSDESPQFVTARELNGKYRAISHVVSWKLSMVMFALAPTVKFFYTSPKWLVLCVCCTSQEFRVVLNYSKNLSSKLQVIFFLRPNHLISSKFLFCDNNFFLDVCSCFIYFQCVHLTILVLLFGRSFLPFVKSVFSSHDYLQNTFQDLYSFWITFLHLWIILNI